jgi:3-deoxy-D-manno-octulosonic-acid transferase
MWFLYEVLYVIGLLFYLPKAIWRRRWPHRGWSMRLGRYPNRITESLRGHRTLWIHAVSVGEVLAVQPLLQALMQTYPKDSLVLSTITPSGFEVASRRLADRGIPIYFPLDLRVCVARTLETIHPGALLLLESELWPTVMRLTKARGVPIAVVNGRISPRAFRRYCSVQPWLRGMFSHVDLFLMQSQADADRIIKLGASSGKVQVTGSLKWDASLGVRPSPQAIQDTAARIGLNGQEVVIVAGSTHRGEEGVVLQAFQALRASHQHVRLIVAPRHLERVPEVEALIRRAGLTSMRLSHLSDVPSERGQAGVARRGNWAVGIVDTFGQLPRYYGLATVAFIGGSLIPHGGQNPLEAASLGKPVVFGPSTHNFADITEKLLTRQAARQLTSGAELAPVLRELLVNPAEAQAMGQRAQELTEGSQGSTRRTLEALKPLLYKSASW